MVVVEIIFLDHLFKVDALFAFKYTYFVASVYDQEHREQNAAECAHSRS